MIRPQRIAFTAFGEAKPAGSKRAFAFKRADGSLGATVTDACKATKSWQHVVATAALEAYHGPLLDGPLSVSMMFYRPRPRGHFGKRGLKQSAPGWPTSRPDVLKLARAVEDALTKIVWTDDARIVVESLEKQWGEPARVEVTISEAEDDAH